MIKRSISVLLALILVLSTPVTALAAEHSAGTSDDVVSAFNNDSDPTVTINLTTDVTMNATVTANENQSYTINGNSYTIRDVAIEGPGSVTINGNVTGGNENIALSVDEATVQVNGDVSDASVGVGAHGGAEVMVNGNISDVEAGVGALGGSSVTVGGDVSGHIYAVADYIDGDPDRPSVTVGGNVDGGIEAYESNVTVGGDVNEGVEAYKSTVHVEGNVSGYSGDPTDVDDKDPTDWSDGGDGIDAYDSTVTVGGNVTGGDSYGTYGYGGYGVHAGGDSTVQVKGSITGGNVYASSDTPTDEDHESRGGVGVWAESSATVTAGGNITGGSTNAATGDAGAGFAGASVVVELTQTQTPGKVTSGGTVSGGTNSDGEQANGVSLDFGGTYSGGGLYKDAFEPDLVGDLDEVLDYIYAVEHYAGQNDQIDLKALQEAMVPVLKENGLEDATSAVEIDDATVEWGDDEKEALATALLEPIRAWATEGTLDLMPSIAALEIKGGVGLEQYSRSEYAQALADAMRPLLESVEKEAITYIDTAQGQKAGEEQTSPLYWVVDEDGKDLPYKTSVKDGVLTITADYDYATLTGQLWGIRSLMAQGIEEICFETASASSTFSAQELSDQGRDQDSYRLTHDGSQVTFQFGEDKTDISGILE